MHHPRTYEIVSFLGALVIAFALGYTQKRKDNIIVDILTNVFRKACAPRRHFCVPRYDDLLLHRHVAVFVWARKYGGRVTLRDAQVIYHPFILAVGFGFGVLALTTLTDFLTRSSTKEG